MEQPMTFDQEIYFRLVATEEQAAAGANSTDLKNLKSHPKHPAPFPIALARRAILLYSMPGDLVCEFFSGSGTTQQAALETGRALLSGPISFTKICEPPAWPKPFQI